MESFIYQSHPSRVIFGRSVLAQAKSEAQRLGLRRILIISSAQRPREAELVQDCLGELGTGTFSGARMQLVFVQPGDNNAVAETNETSADLVLVSPKFEGSARRPQSAQYQCALSS
jgi:alcohol dehydrogenase class IV